MQGVLISSVATLMGRIALTRNEREAEAKGPLSRRVQWELEQRPGLVSYPAALEEGVQGGRAGGSTGTAGE